MRTGPAVTLTPVDVSSETDLLAWWEVGRAASADRAFDAWPSWDVARRTWPQPRTDVLRQRVLARDDAGRAVGAGMLALFQLDNTHLAELEVHVAPDARRQGVGSAVLADLEARAVAEGRTTLVGTAYAPVGAESAGSLFCAARGYPVGNHEEVKLLDLRTAPADWAALDAEVAAGLGGYSVVGFVDRVPDEHVAAFCDLLSVFLTMIPAGDLELEAMTWTPERLHEHEQRTVASGHAWIGALGLTPGGTACGFTELDVAREDPRHATVGGTLVLPEHRGHRLGLAMKLHSHRQVLDLFPACEHVETGNAGANAPMNAVNAAMGYRVVERALDVQKRVTAS